jgi:hypothetical protein
MSKNKLLYELPHNLMQSYFATDKYCLCGYMSDWLLNMSKYFDINTVIIDILKGTHEPKEFNIHPFTYELQFLNRIISNKLHIHNFDMDFIKEAKIKVVTKNNSNELQCFAWIIDKNNNRFESKPIVEVSYSDEFDPIVMSQKIRENKTVY